MPLNRERFDLNDAADRAIELYREVAETKEVTLESGVRQPAAVLADRVRIEQAAANLIDNAVKYTPPGGRVVVDVETVDGRAVLRVRDTGLGVAASELPRIWDRLFRGDRSRTTRGLGLGLSLVKAIVEAHGGTVSVDSEPGKGSVFALNLERTDYLSAM